MKILKSAFAKNPVAVQVGEDEVVLGTTIEEAPEIVPSDVIDFWLEHAIEDPAKRREILARFCINTIDEMTQDELEQLREHVAENYPIA